MTHPLSANCPIDRSGLWRPFTRWATRAAGGRFLIGRRPLDVPWMRVELAVMMLTPIGVVSSSSSGTVLSTRCRVHALSAARNESEARFDTCTVRSSSSSRNKVLNELLLIRLLVEIALLARCDTQEKEGCKKDNFWLINLSLCSSLLDGSLVAFFLTMSQLVEAGSPTR